MKEYTLDIHVERLERMLMKEDACSCCPASPRFSWSRINTSPCRVCMDFVEVPHYRGCPCNVYGPTEALVRTYDALAAYYRREK